MKLIYDEIKDSKQIYDLSEDPYERNDLSGRHSEENRRLSALLSKWIDYVEIKQNKGQHQDENKLFTPEQIEQLKSLGYL